MDYDEIINKEPLGSIERLFLISENGDCEKSEAAKRCIKKRLAKKELK